MVTPAMRTTAVLLGFLNFDTGNEDNSSFARFFKLDKYAMTPAMRTTAVLLGFLNLTNMPCSVLP